MAWIAEVDTDLVVWLMESLAGNPGPTNLICDLVTKADQTSVERDLKTLGVAMAGYDLGVPVERHLIDIMREGIINIDSDANFQCDQTINAYETLKCRRGNSVTVGFGQCTPSAWLGRAAYVDCSWCVDPYMAMNIFCGSDGRSYDVEPYRSYDGVNRYDYNWIGYPWNGSYLPQAQCRQLLPAFHQSPTPVLADQFPMCPDGHDVQLRVHALCADVALW